MFIATDFCWFNSEQRFIIYKCILMSLILIARLFIFHLHAFYILGKRRDTRTARYSGAAWKTGMNQIRCSVPRYEQ